MSNYIEGWDDPVQHELETLRAENAALREQRDRLAAALYDMAMRNNDGSADAILAEIGEGK